MKRKILVIGIGAGNPDYVTMQAVEALNRADVFFIPDKGTEKRELAETRRAILDRFVRGKAARSVGFDVPKRKSAEEAGGYRETVLDWHGRIADGYRRMLADELSEDEVGAFLVWGDPALYDSTIRILDRLNASGLDIDFDVIPGITAVQALAARHRVPLNEIGQPVLITTGRRLAERFPEEADSVVVMLDGENTYRRVDGDLDIYWGAYLGTHEEILVSGKVSDVAEEIEKLRAEARGRNGWIMDTYMLRRGKPGDPTD